MLDPKNIITELSKISKNYFPESSFYFERKNNYKFYSTGNNSSKAINHNKHSLEEINVVKWFADFWVYIEITFYQLDKDNINTFFTLSVFEGSDRDNNKNQLFRAEWDTYEDNQIHPQPHWHFFSSSIIENLFIEFSEIVEKEQSGFVELINDEKSKNINIDKMHFAMSAIWDKNIDGHVHPIADDEKLISWYKGLMSHIKNQLEYVK
jgi:hypothetical protein